LRTQFITSIINKEFTETAKFKGFHRSFETLIKLHDNAGSAAHRVPMGDEMKRELLIATLKDPAVLSAKQKESMEGGSLAHNPGWAVNQRMTLLPTKRWYNG